MLYLDKINSLVKFAKPNEILYQLDKLITQSIAASLTQVEDLILDQLEKLVSENDETGNVTNIRFSVQVLNGKFKFVPYNLYTYLLSEGIYVPYKDIEHRKQFKHGEYEYFFNSIENYGVKVPTK